MHSQKAILLGVLVFVAASCATENDLDPTTGESTSAGRATTGSPTINPTFRLRDVSAPERGSIAAWSMSPSSSPDTATTIRVADRTREALVTRRRVSTGGFEDSFLEDLGPEPIRTEARANPGRGNDRDLVLDTKVDQVSYTDGAKIVSAASSIDVRITSPGRSLADAPVMLIVDVLKPGDVARVALRGEQDVLGFSHAFKVLVDGQDHRVGFDGFYHKIDLATMPDIASGMGLVVQAVARDESAPNGWAATRAIPHFGSFSSRRMELVASDLGRDAHFGDSILLEDLDGDGKDEIIVAAPTAKRTDHYDRPGAVAIVYGPDLSRTRVLEAEDTNQDAWFGHDFKCGDVTGDGHKDVIVAAPGDTVGNRTHAGSVYVFSGPTYETYFRITNPKQDTSFGFGSALALTDWNGDGVLDVVASDMGRNRGKFNLDDTKSDVYRNRGKVELDDTKSDVYRNRGKVELDDTKSDVYRNRGKVELDDTKSDVYRNRGKVELDDTKSDVYRNRGKVELDDTKSDVYRNRGKVELDDTKSDVYRNRGKGSLDDRPATFHDQDAQRAMMASVFDRPTSKRDRDAWRTPGPETAAMIDVPVPSVVTIFMGPDFAVYEELDNPNGSDDTVPFGKSLQGGDIDADGYGDIIVAARQRSNRSEEPRDVLFVYRSPAVAARTAITAPEDTKSDLGRRMELKDMDRDGNLDIVASAEFQDGVKSDAGALRVFYGPDWMRRKTVVSPDTKDSQLFGSDLRVADYNKDSYPDILVGERAGSPTGDADRAGRAWVFLGPDYKAYLGLSPDRDMKGAEAGRSVAWGDIDGDGKLESVLAAPLRTTKPMSDTEVRDRTPDGRVYIYR